MIAATRQPSLPFRTIVSVAILLYVFASAVYMLPASRFRNMLAGPITPVLMYTGLWQNFAVFSPDPRFNNVYLSAVVTFADGSTQYFEFPRNNHLPLLERIYKERFRKYGLDNMYWDAHRVLWPDAARYVARQYKDKAPLLISLQRHWQDLPLPESGLGKPLDDDFASYTFYIHRVQPEDLK